MSKETCEVAKKAAPTKIAIPYRHYYYLKCFADLRRVSISEAIRYLFANREETSDAWIDKRFAHFDRPPQLVVVDDELKQVNIESLMKRLESLPGGIRPMTDGPYETNVKFFEDEDGQAIEIYGLRIYDFKRKEPNHKMAGILALVEDLFPFKMTPEQYEVYRRTGSQFWRLINDPRERAALPNEGEIAMDVGAYVGQRALAMHYCVGKTGRTYAIEVEDENFRLLKKNAEVNRLDNFIPLQEAVDEISREAKLFTRTPRSMSHGLRPFENINDPEVVLENKTTKSKKVMTKTLDQIFTEHGITRMDVVHISVTGHEIEVLRGLNECLPALRTLRVSCPYKDADGVPNIDTAQKVLEEKGFGNFRRQGPALTADRLAV